MSTGPSVSDSEWTQAWLRLLASPFTRLEPWMGDQAPVGGLLVADIRDGIPSLAHALRAQRAASWCPLCLVVDGSIAPGELSCFEPWPGAFGFTVSPSGSGWPAPPAIVHAIRSRRRPEPSYLAAYVTLRTGSAAQGALLSTQLADYDKTARPSPRTVARRCMELGLLLPHEWSRLGELVGWILASSDCGGSVERKAARAGVDQRTLRRWLERLPGVSIAHASATPGWEWILEMALRRFGYIEGIAASALPVTSSQVG